MLSRRTYTTVPAHRSRRYAVCAAALIASAVAAPAAHAGVLTFGSNLTAPANVVEARQADTAYWQTQFAGGANPLAPTAGQITSVRLKGVALADPKAGIPGGETMWHLQALRAQPDGTFKILRSSQAFYVPTTGDPQQVTTYKPENFCVDQGDVVAFNTVGGWDGIMTGTGPYPYGTPLQIFSGVAGGSVSQFTGADQTNNGDILRADHTRAAGQELLMQMTLGTATDAVLHCPGGLYNPYRLGGGTSTSAPATARIQKVTVPAKQRVSVSKKGKLTVALFCLPGASDCAGTVRVLKRRGKAISLGVRRFDIGAKQPGRATIFLNKTGRRLFKRGKGRLAVRIVAETRPGGTERTSTLRVTLRKRVARG